jgi:hypothetical protein
MTPRALTSFSLLIMALTAGCASMGAMQRLFGGFPDPEVGNPAR